MSSVFIWVVAILNLWLKSRDVINFMNMSWDISKFYIHDMELRRGSAYHQLTSALLIGLSRDFHFWWCDYKNNLQIFKFLCDIMPSAMIMTHWIIKGGLLSKWERIRSTVIALKKSLFKLISWKNRNINE